MKAYVVICHPRTDSFTHAAAQRVIAGIDTSDCHEVRVTDLHADGFVPEMSAEERLTHADPPDAKTSIAPHATDLQWCDTLVLVYPTWWSAQPAMLKGWIDRVWVQGIAWTLPPGATRLRPKLHNIRRIVAVTTHGSSKRLNAIQGEAGKRTVTRALRVLCHPLARTSWIALYDIDRCDDHRRTAFLDRVEREVASMAATRVDGWRALVPWRR